MLYIIGHSAYSGANARKACLTRAKAIRVLRHRGFTRNAARALTAPPETQRTEVYRVGDGDRGVVECQVFLTGHIPDGANPEYFFSPEAKRYLRTQSDL